MKFSTVKFIALFAAILFAASCAKEPDHSFIISGLIKNYQSGKLVLILEEDVNRKQSRIIGEIPIGKDGTFEMAFEHEPNIYTLNFYDKKKVAVAIDKDQKLVIEGDANDWSIVKISGSPDTEKLEAYEEFRKSSLAELVTKIRDDIKKLQATNDPTNSAKVKRLSDLEIENFAKHKDELIDFVAANMGTSIAVYATSLRWDGDQNVAKLAKIAAEFAAAHPNLAVTAKLSEKVSILKNTSIGGTAADIKMADKDGVEKSLSSISAKFILIDFWGSWCGPCRREATELASLYDEFQPKGFEIFGIGLESEKEEWFDAMETDKRIWTNVSAIQEFETPATFEYAVTSLPANFLIDSERKIIGKNLHGKELREKISSLLMK